MYFLKEYAFAVGSFITIADIQFIIKIRFRSVSILRIKVNPVSILISTYLRVKNIFSMLIATVIDPQLHNNLHNNLFI